MTNRWEAFSQANAEFYILTKKGVDYSKPEGQELFYSSGVQTTVTYLARVEKYLNCAEKALEIGCGIGRLTFPHAKVFKEIFAVDISTTMLAKLNRNANTNMVLNIKTFTPNQCWDIPKNLDYVYSWLTFQHIQELSVIENYIQRIGKALKKQGVAQLHFDTRYNNVFYQIRNNLPDFLLPEIHHRGIRRIRRNSCVLRELFKNNQLDILEEISRETADHTFILQKA